MLIITYIITAIFVLTGFQFLKITGIFFGICYLPGLTLIALIKKDRLEIGDLALAFPCAIGLSSLLTLILLYAGVHVQFIAYTIYGIAACFVLLYILIHKELPRITIKLSDGDIKFLVIAFLMTLMFSIPLISDRLAISAHGFHHLSIVTSVINGFFPPDNPGLGGAAINYHWGYHSLIAAISFPINFHPLYAFSTLNIMSLFFIFCLSYRSAKSFGISETYCYLVPLALIGLMRSDAGFFVAKKLFSGNLPLVQNIFESPMELLTSWVWGVSYLDTRLFFMNKFYNANNMPLGICIMFAFFLIILLLEEKKNSTDRNTLFLILAVVLTALSITYPFFLIIPLLFAPIWSGILFWTNRGSFRVRLKEALHLMIPCIIAAIIAVPYLLALSSGGNVLTMGKSFSEVKFIYWNDQIIRNLIVFLLPLPLISVGFWVAFKQFAFSRKMLFLLSGIILCMLLSIFLRLRFYNDAKFSFILSYFFSFLFVFSLLHLIPLFSQKWLRRCIMVSFIVFLLTTPLLTEAVYICSSRFSDTTYAFSGKHVIFNQDESRNEAYAWIRDNTPPNSLLLLPYLTAPYTGPAQNINYMPAALSERSLFIIEDVYAYIYPEYKNRVAMRDKLFNDYKNPQMIQYFASLNRPVYLLLEEGYPDPLFVDIKFDQIPENATEEFVPVFRNDRQRVYLISYSVSKSL